MTTIKTLTTSEARDLLGFRSASTIQNAIRCGELRAEKIGRDWHISLNDLLAWDAKRTPKRRGRDKIES